MNMTLFWSWPPTIGAVGVARDRGAPYTVKCLTVITSPIHEHDLVLVLTAHNRGGRSCPRPGRSLYRQMPTLITFQIHEHDLVLVLTAHNRGGRSCPRPGRSIFPVGQLYQFFYEYFVFCLYLRRLLGVVGDFCGAWLPFCALQRTPFYL